MKKKKTSSRRGAVGTADTSGESVIFNISEGWNMGGGKQGCAEAGDSETRDIFLGESHWEKGNSESHGGGTRLQERTIVSKRRLSRRGCLIGGKGKARRKRREPERRERHGPMAKNFTDGGGLFPVRRSHFVKDHQKGQVPNKQTSRRQVNLIGPARACVGSRGT